MVVTVNFRSCLRLFRIVLILLSISVAHSANRVALVVGNDDYQNVTPLQNAVHDAKTIADTLSTLNFDVLLVTDAGRREFNKQFQLFVSKIGPGDVAMLYYAGHSIEISGQNFLLPVDVPPAQLGQEGFLKSESISLQNILLRLRELKAQLNIVVLDACRDNPFATANGRGVGGTRGLAAVNPPKGTFILYSADAGESALDRLGEDDQSKNSIFTRTLVPFMLQPGINLPDMARRVRTTVNSLAKTVSHEQTPAYYDAMFGDFYFSEATETENTNESVEQQSAYAGNALSFHEQVELEYWNSVAESQDIDEIQSYIDKYPTGNFIDLAQIRIARLKPIEKKNTVNESSKSNKTAEPELEADSKPKDQITDNEPTQSDSNQFLTQQQMIEQVVGHTYRGISALDDQTLYYETLTVSGGDKESGVIKGVWGRDKEKYSGEWTVKKDGQICFTYGEGDPSNGCWLVRIVADKMLFYIKGEDKPDGKPVTLLP